MHPLLLLGGLVVVAAIVLVIVVLMLSRRRLSRRASQRVRGMIDRAGKASDPVLRVLEYDKVLDHLLHELGYAGSTGQKMIRGAGRFSNKEVLWKCHKLRNVIAHEHGASVHVSDADRFKHALEKALLEVSFRS